MEELSVAVTAEGTLADLLPVLQALLQESMARTREIDRLGEARDVQGLLRIASEQAPLYDTFNCSTWLSR